jgi:DNA (cytosine-5)-methyltransferase 1
MIMNYQDFISSAKPAKKRFNPTEELTFASIFSGGGLIDVGAIHAGYSPIWGIEYDLDIAELYKKNISDLLIVKAAETVNYLFLQSPTWLHVSPPCVNFSQVKTNGGENNLDLVHSDTITTALDRLLPYFFTIENVGSYAKSESIIKIKKRLDAARYSYTECLIDASKYGVPQKRKRYFLIAIKSPEKINLELRSPIPLPSNDIVGWFEAIHKLEMPKMALTETISNEVTQDDKLGDLLIETTGNRRNFRELLQKSPDSPSWTIRSSISRTSSRPIQCRIAGEYYSLTPRAIARLQSVPDWYELGDRASTAIKMLGNGVPSYFAYQLGERLKQFI